LEFCYAKLQLKHYYTAIHGGSCRQSAVGSLAGGSGLGIWHSLTAESGQAVGWGG